MKNGLLAFTKCFDGILVRIDECSNPNDILCTVLTGELKGGFITLQSELLQPIKCTEQVCIY